MKPDLVLVHAGELVTMGGEGLGAVEDGALAVAGGRVAWVGTTRELKRKAFGMAARTVDAGGRLVTPGFVDPHTHLLFAGSREDELEKKASGRTYLEIMSAGGGIPRTVRETRRAGLGRLVAEAGGRLAQLLRNGVTTAEVKTGYGQDVRTEAKLMRAISVLAEKQNVELVPTFMGLHAKPPEFRSAHEYVAYATGEILPRVSAMGAVFSDCFCEEGVFSRDECKRYLEASKALGLRLKVHADEFSDSGGASLAAEEGCVSADHLGRSSAEGIGAMARGGVVATLLPGTSLCSGIPYADAEGILAAGCRVALGTDLSPNSWVESPQLVMGLACAAMRLTPAQALRGFTANAAAALARDDVGRLVSGCKADFVVHDLPGHESLPYRLGGSYVSSVFKEGVEVCSRPLA